MSPSIKAVPAKPWIETPLIESATLSKLAGCRIFLKLELLQPSGSFKSRGIGNLILAAATNPANQHKSLHFYSSSGGNAGLAAVHAARTLGHPCTVVLPTSTKPLMLSRLRAAGVTAVIQHGATWADADRYLRAQFIDDKAAAAHGHVAVYVPPFDDPLIWAGAGTMVPEIAAQLGGSATGGAFPADAVVCSVGGGGLVNGVIAGLSEYADASGRVVQVVAAETRGADSLAHALRAGRLASLEGITSEATSLGALCVSETTFEHARAPPEGMKVVSVVGTDAEAARGVLRLADEMRLEVELACGISLEVAVGGQLKKLVPGLGPESRVVVVVCGGSNITAEMITEYRARLEAGWE
ncbi:L-serine dehydratase [Penicillium macrosclerotiorum]|uniref:L-serine dehydratase n=1 Tax=Penicillium macrosclerotiorum TaxID=303699 RepID=UPI0025495B82|nr:L-serine dehydratase [Penicillium macrosclerotiorum]KAJ5678714.1 L-serine dehydratase [Penicillium macrosclerotiorum]